MGKETILETLKGDRVLVSPQDYLLFKHMKWGIDKNGYVRTWRHKKLEKYKYKTIVTLLHNLIVRPKAGYVVDHINRNKLDNRRENLRLVTRAENAINTYFFDKASGVRKRNKKWLASGHIKNKSIYLGSFDSKEEAITMRELWCIYRRENIGNQI